MSKIGLIPYITGAGGVHAFMHKFIQGAQAQGVETTFDLEEKDLDAVLVLAGTRRVDALWRVRRRGIPIVQRLDGINWIQRRRWAGWRYTLRAEYGNLNLAFIRRALADKLIYQSHFVRAWWEDWFGKPDKPSRVIHNAVDLQRYTPDGAHERPSDAIRIQVVEGSLGGVLSIGLDWAVGLSNRLAEKGLPVRLHIAGEVPVSDRAAAQKASRIPIVFAGRVAPERIPYLNRSAHLYFSAEVNAACSNAVIEALACGAPVIGFDSGALRELAPPSAGQIVPYGGDPWKLETPDLDALAAAAQIVLDQWDDFHHNARAHACQHFDLADMTARYLDFLLT